MVEGSTAKVELRPGEKFFRVEGVPRFLLGRNPAGVSPEAFDEHFAHAAAAGERLMRIHFAYMPPGEKAGEIYPDGIIFLDHLFESAAKNGLAILPVLGVWADWNDGSGNETWHAWDKNPFNAANGGPGRSPTDLLHDTDCRKLWLKRIQFFVERWGKYRNIVAWELFSELNLITGSNEKEAVAFTKAVADAVRRARANASQPIQIITMYTGLGKADSEGWISGRQLLSPDGTNPLVHGGWSWLLPKRRSRGTLAV